MTANTGITRRQATGRLTLGLTLGMLILLLAPLAACGKKSSPEPPEGEEITYPRTYPRR